LHRDRAVEIGPGADDDSVDLVRLDEVFPVLEDARDLELACHPGGGVAVLVADADNLDPRQRLEAGKVPCAGNRPRADDADADHALPHAPPVLSPRIGPDRTGPAPPAGPARRL